MLYEVITISSVSISGTSNNTNSADHFESINIDSKIDIFYSDIVEDSAVGAYVRTVPSDGSLTVSSFSLINDYGGMFQIDNNGVITYHGSSLDYDNGNASSSLPEYNLIV